MTKVRNAQMRKRRGRGEVSRARLQGARERDDVIGLEENCTPLIHFSILTTMSYLGCDLPFPVDQVLAFKWRTYARRLFLTELAVFLIYLALFVTFGLTLADLRLNPPHGRVSALGAKVVF